MLELKAIHDPRSTVEEVNLIPELTDAEAKTADPHGEANAHHSTGRHRITPLLDCLPASTRRASRAAATEDAGARGSRPETKE